LSLFAIVAEGGPMQELWNLFLRFAGLVALVSAVAAAYYLAMAYRAQRTAKSALFDAERQVMNDRVSRSGFIGLGLLGVTGLFFVLALTGGGSAAPAEQATRAPTHTNTPRVGTRPAQLGTPTSLPTLSGPTVPPPPGMTNTPAPASPTASTPGGSKTAIVTGTADVGGLKLRATPNGEIIDALPDGTVVQLLNETKTEVGIEWQKVRDPKNREGWVAGQYLIINP
jgi:hypothetical protein